jgi:hypothetical protein
MIRHFCRLTFFLVYGHLGLNERFAEPEFPTEIQTYKRERRKIENLVLLKAKLIKKTTF